MVNSKAVATEIGSAAMRRYNVPGSGRLRNISIIPPQKTLVNKIHLDGYWSLC
jgi:hypothetical protein